MLIVARAFQSFGACAGPVIGRAIVRDLFGREEAAKVMAYIGMTMGIAPVFAPVLGGYLEEWYGWQASFAVVTLFAAFMLWLSWARLPETNKYLETNAEWGSLGLASYARLLRSREYLGFVISGSLVYGGMFAFNVGSPFVVIQILGRTPSEFGLLSVMPIAGWLIGSFVTSRIAERIGINRLLPIGIAILFISGLAFAVLALAGDPSIFSLYTPMTIMAFGMALVFPSTLAGAVSVYPEIAGTASALYGFLQMVASFAGIQLLGFFEDGTDMPMVWVTTGAMTMATVVFLMLVQRGRRERSVAR
jgi:DHA1 family bicyclomycin/chloramphenicol resistance-like MFS transporter